MSKRLILPKAWEDFLPEWEGHPDSSRLAQFLKTAYAENTVYPKPNRLLQALKVTAPDDVRVVILGQDPYHGADQATGFAFSVPKGLRLPPSLRNIYKEMASDLEISLPDKPSGDLTPWAEQGVLLLNTTFSVEASLAGSHRKKGWESLSDLIIQKLATEKEGLVFILWGADAIKKEALIPNNGHCILKSVHPSPLSSHRGFFGSKPFSACNNYLVSQGKEPIDWAKVLKD